MKCLFSGCETATEFAVFQTWDRKLVCTCAQHVPGNHGGSVPNPTEPEKRGAYLIYPFASMTAAQLEQTEAICTA